MSCMATTAQRAGERCLGSWGRALRAAMARLEPTVTQRMRATGSVGASGGWIAPERAGRVKGEGDRATRGGSGWKRRAGCG